MRWWNLHHINVGKSSCSQMKIAKVSFKIPFKFVCSWVPQSEIGRSFHSRGPQTLKVWSPAARHRWVQIDGTDRSIPSVADRRALGDALIATSSCRYDRLGSLCMAEWTIERTLNMIRDWTGSQWRSFRTGVIWSFFSISLLAWQHCFVQAVIHVTSLVYSNLLCTTKR